MTTSSVFASHEDKAWPYKYKATILVDHLVAGTPTDQKAIEGWVKKNVGADNPQLIQEVVAKTMAEMEIGLDEAVDAVTKSMKLNAFKRDANGLYIEGRHVKACLKEAVSVCVAANKLAKGGWGVTKKGALSFVAEHVYVAEDRLALGRSEPDGIQQRFVQTWRGSGIQNEEYVEDVLVSFTVGADYRFTDEQWAVIWLTAERQGIGATRSQGYGRFTVTAWDPQ